MKKSIRYILIILVTVILGGVAMTLFNSSKRFEGDTINLRESEENIRENIFKITPIGSNIEKVIEIIESNEKWKNEYERFERGYALKSIGNPPEGYFPTVYYSNEESNVIGVYSIRANIGTYHNFFRRDVLVYWGFDEDLKLIDIAVHKDVDSL